MIKSRNGSKPHYNDYNDFIGVGGGGGVGSNGAKYNGNIISDRSPNGMSSKKSAGGSKFYGDFLTLTPRRNKMNEYLQYQQQSHEPYDHMAGRKPHHNNYYQNHLHRDEDRDEQSYLHSLDTLKLDDEHNILHSKLFYQPSSENSGNEYVISGNNINNNQIKKHHVVTTNVHSSNNPNNIVSPPNQFNDNSTHNINRFIKL